MDTTTKPDSSWGSEVKAAGACVAPGPIAAASTLVRKACLLAGALALLSCPSIATPQRIIWDHTGDALREVQPTSFARLADMDGDGVHDFLIGCSQMGWAAIRSGADDSAIAHYYQPYVNQHNTGFGRSVRNIGLFDGDGIPDFAIGAAFLTDPVPGAGEVHVFSGATGQRIVRIVEDVAFEGIGFRVIPLGDLNGDGFDDIGEIGAHIAAPLRIYLGPDGAPYREHGSVGVVSAAPYGDYDGDGRDDYLIGTPSWVTHQQAEGRVDLHSGHDGSVLLTLFGRLTQGAAGAGQSICTAGDWNGDGVDDVAVGAPATANLSHTFSGTGLYVFSGADGSILRFIDGWDYCGSSSAFGWAVASGRDVNGDGMPDLVVSAPMETFGIWPNQEWFLGSVFVFSGATMALLWEHRGSNEAEYAGAEVAMIEDHDGDGIDDWMALGPGHVVPSQWFWDHGGRLTVFAGAVGDVTTHCQAGTNSIGREARLWNSGPISLGQNTMELSVDGMPGGKPAIFIHGQLTPATPFGQGELCVSGSLAVLDIAVTSSGAPGAPQGARIHVDLAAPPFTAGGNTLQPGDRWAFQVVYRDGGGRNTSNALEVTFLP